MFCPECDGEQFCPCKHCILTDKQVVTWIWVTPDGPIACGHCGLIMTVDEWALVELAQAPILLR